uniref:Uncharacterized protein n=1 Tax=Leersia perrieri TaxID=77586 RepID=A0A0D9W332_9ORYZ
MVVDRNDAPARWKRPPEFLRRGGENTGAESFVRRERGKDMERTAKRGALLSTTDFSMKPRQEMKPYQYDATVLEGAKATFKS